MGLFSSASKGTQVGVDFLSDGVAVAQVRVGSDQQAQILQNDFLDAQDQSAQSKALKQWVEQHNLQNTPCVCLLAEDDCDLYQVEKPDVEDAELSQALTWKIKDLINYDVSNAVIESYTMPRSTKTAKEQIGVVAARESVVVNYVDSIRMSGLDLVALDVHELVRSNLELVVNGEERTFALLTLADNSGLLSIYHDTDLYVSRDFKLGLNQLEQISQDNTDEFDSLLLEVQRSVDYYESYFGLGGVTDLQIYPQQEITEKMAKYLQNLTNFDIVFLLSDSEEASTDLDSKCFHAYCAALRGATR